MDYKPYSMEWSRRRYLAESIQQYFDTDASVDVVLDDIVDILEEKVEHMIDSLKTDATIITGVVYNEKSKTYLKGNKINKL